MLIPEIIPVAIMGYLTLFVSYSKIVYDEWILTRPDFYRTDELFIIEPNFDVLVPMHDDWDLKVDMNSIFIIIPGCKKPIRVWSRKSRFIPTKPVYVVKKVDNQYLIYTSSGLLLKSYSDSDSQIHKSSIVK